jgi:hypothetical protein
VDGGQERLMEGNDGPTTFAHWWRELMVPGYTRWAYLAPALAAFMFVGHAWEDAGWQGGSPYAFVLVVSILQLVRPTLLGWLLSTIPFLVYLVVFVMEAPRNPVGEWLTFLLIGLIPTLALVWARPRPNPEARQGRAQDTSAARDDAG